MRLQNEKNMILVSVFASHAGISFLAPSLNCIDATQLCILGFDTRPLNSVYDHIIKVPF